MFLIACGVQGPPRPPRIERPEAVQDLTVSQIGRTFLLTFTPPQLATDGERLTKPLEVRFFRAIHPSGQSAADGSPENPWIVLQPEDVQRYTRNERVAYPVHLSDPEFTQWQGATFAFSVSALTRGFRRRPVESGPSNKARATLLAVSGPVEDLRIKPEEKALELSWSPPSRGANEVGSLEPSGYRVYRSRTGKPGSYELLGETTNLDYSDPDFELDRPVVYRVRAVFKDSAQVAESEDSPVAEITPRDVYPPVVPRGLSAIYTGEGVEIIWSANVEPDLAGYNIYRGEVAGTLQKVNQQLLATPVFRDSSTEASRSYLYRVTAVDLAGNESDASERVAVETR
jgi:hypothetical protein